MSREKKGFLNYLRSTISDTYWLLYDLDKQVVEETVEGGMALLEELDFYSKVSIKR